MWKGTFGSLAATIDPLNHSPVWGKIISIYMKMMYLFIFLNIIIQYIYSPLNHHPVWSWTHSQLSTHTHTLPCRSYICKLFPCSHTLSHAQSWCYFKVSQLSDYKQTDPSVCTHKMHIPPAEHFWMSTAMTHTVSHSTSFFIVETPTPD